MGKTLEAVAASDHPGSRGAAALIEAGLPGSTPLAALTPGGVIRELVESLARELEQVHEQLGDVYESAVVDTATGDSLQVLVDELCPRRPWWCWLFRSRG